jgi:hypothetical protein
MIVIMETDRRRILGKEMPVKNISRGADDCKGMIMK